ncbi:molybdopterin-dependent oxidoreductase [Flavitalea sp.]|nr:molybdopterin-dependent oxidoreductase [Flavitalea sp.]
MRKFIFHCFFTFLVTLPLTFYAQVATTKTAVKVSGEVTKQLLLTKEDLSKMARTTAIFKDRDGKDVPYSGVAVQHILELAGVTMGKQLRGENLAKYLLIKCSDGYEVVFSLAELDKGFNDKLVILADKSNGADLPIDKGPFRIIVQGDKVPARSSFQVTEMIIKFAKD